jgi:hypothetical protein
MNDPDAINTRLLEPFDQSLIEDKQGKRYIGHEHIRMRVIEATTNQFDWTVTGREIRGQDGVIRARPKTGTIPPVMIVDGLLTIPGLGSRAGTGVQVLEDGAGEDTYKAAESDAFKRAAMAFGVGLQQLYMGGSASATSRPQTRQPTPIRTREKLSDKEFDEKVRQWVSTKDPQIRMELIEDAADLLGRWLVLVAACESEQALSWIERKYEYTGGTSELMKDAIEKRRATLSDPNHGAIG